MFRFLIVVMVFMFSVMFTQNTTKPPVKKLPLSQPTPTEQFMRRVAHIESDNNHRVVNEFGMMGKYQFSPSTVRALGFKMDNKTFLSNPKLQDTVMLKYMKANQSELRAIIKRYDGKHYKGIKVTRAGIIAGAHFAGSDGVVRFFREDGSGVSDARGTTVKKYMAYFSNFNLPEL